MTGGGEPLPFEQLRLLLDALALGMEQTMRRLGERPSLPAFRDWIVATAGVPIPDRLARYHAALAGDRPPPATAAMLAVIDAAPPVLDADDLAHWDEHGYVVVRAAIDRAAAANAAALVWQHLGASPDDPDSWYAAGNIWVPIYQHPALEVARRSPRVHKAFAQLWGTADLWMSHDKMSFNPPERAGYQFQGSPLHWDISLAQPIPFGTAGILYLTDTAADQGAFRLVSGFHRGLADWLDHMGDADPRQAPLGDRAVPVAGDAGDLIVWRLDLPHGASPNTADRPRLAQYLNMYPASWRANPVWR